jgi:nucleotide-binding universal stress UspA family protein
MCSFPDSTNLRLAFGKDIAMFHKIMVAYDESPEAGKALETAIELARCLGGELKIVTVIEPFPAYYSFAPKALPVSEWSGAKREKYASLQAKARQLAKAAGLWLDTEMISGDEVGSIIECARKYRADLLVLGMRKHRLLMGYTAHDVAERSPCALLGVR